MYDNVELYQIYFIVYFLLQILRLRPEIVQIKLQKDMETSSLSDIPTEQHAGEEKSGASRLKRPLTAVSEKVNQDLLVPKLSFFFYFMAIGAFLPYLGVFYKQLWITARESGILLGIRPFIKTLVSPLWGMLADAFNRPKLILLISIFGCLVGYFSQSIVSPFELPCYKGSYEEYLANKTENRPKNVSKRNLLSFSNKENVFFDSEKLFMIPLSNSKHHIGKKTTTKREVGGVKTRMDIVELEEDPSGVRSNGGQDIFPRNDQSQLRTNSKLIMEFEKGALSENGEDMKALYEEDLFSKKQNSKKGFLSKIHKSEPPRPKPKDDFRVKNNKEIFITLLVIVILGEFIASPAPLLADMGTLALLRGREHEYGNQRLFGSFGWGLGSLITGAAVTAFNHCPYSDSFNYLPSFYVFAAAMFCNFIVSIFFKFDASTQQVASSSEPSFLQGLKIFCSIKNGAFIFVLFFFGLSHSLQLSFLFWFLQDIGGTPLLFTTIVLMNSVGEVIMFFCATYFVAKVGNDGVLYFGLICYGVRFLFYSYVQNPWLVLPLEFLQGITYGGVWTASVSYVGQQPGSGATIQGIIHGAYWGLGMAIGGVVGGLLVHVIGARITFRMEAITSFIILIVFFVINNLDHRRKNYSKIPTTSEADHETEGEEEDEQIRYDKKPLDK